MNGYGYMSQQPMYPPAMPDYLAGLRGQAAQPMLPMQQPVVQPQQMAQQSMPQTTQQPTSGIIWVQGEAGAKSYLVAPGSSVQLWDSENDTIYIKSADQNGMPTMRIFDYHERNVQNVPNPEPANMDMYVRRDEFEALAQRLEELTARKTKKRDVEETENA